MHVWQARIVFYVSMKHHSPRHGIAGAKTPSVCPGSVSGPTGTASVVLLPAAIWKPLMFMFLANSLSISTAGFVDNFYLDPATEEESLVWRIICGDSAPMPSASAAKQTNLAGFNAPGRCA